jgi:hypothetical protein
LDLRCMVRLRLLGTRTDRRMGGFLQKLVSEFGHI